MFRWLKSSRHGTTSQDGESILIQFKTGDILQEDVEALVNTVNCVGVMGRGIALQFKKAFPENFKGYVSACKHGLVTPGKMLVYDTNGLTNPRYIINFPTKQHWRDRSKIQHIASGLEALAVVLRDRDIKSVAIPALGCGLGGLDWTTVRPLIEKICTPLTNVRIVVYEPNAAPVTPMPAGRQPAGNMTAGRAALIELMHRYLKGLMDPSVTLLEVHKLLYFMQAAGEPLRLKYTKGIYGPYAENLRHVLSAVEGHLLLGYADGGDSPDKELEILPGAIEQAQQFLNSHPDTQARLERVSQLVEGFESSFGLELLATVHWLRTTCAINSNEELVHATYAWGKQKQQFTPRQIELANTVLTEKGWFTQNQAES